jgi:hypothetical protein
LRARVTSKTRCTVGRLSVVDFSWGAIIKHLGYYHPGKIDLLIQFPLNLAAMSAQLTLNLAEGSVSFNFTAIAAQELKQALDTLLTSLKVVAARTQTSGAKVTPQPSTEYRHVGEVFLELFCNPNIWPTPFAAKVLLTVRDERIRLTTEAELSRIVEDLNRFLEQVE